MADSGALSPATTADDTTIGSIAWTNPNNSQSSNDSYAVADFGYSNASYYLKATNFGFAIPTGATINGIVVEVERKKTGLIIDNSIKIVKGGVIGGTEQNASAAWPAGDTYATFGSSTNLWGLTWTPADINASNFGMVISCASLLANSIAYIDHIRITVYYTDAGFTNPTNAFSSNDSYTTVAGTSGDISIKLSGDAGATYSSALTKTFTGVEGLQTYGAGSTELWGQSWLGSNVSDTNFRLRITVDSLYRVYKTFGFAPSAGVVLTGIEVSVEAKWNGATTSIDHVKVKIYYGTSTTEVKAGSVAFVTDGGAAGTGALATYNGSSWLTDISVMQTIYPVGSIYISTLSTNPATLLGFGTWSAFGAGRVLVGKAGSGTFATGGATGGAETHTLTSDEMPSHTHIQNAHGHAQNSHTHTQDAHTHGLTGRPDDGTSTGAWYGSVEQTTQGVQVDSIATDAATATNHINIIFCIYKGSKSSR